MEGVRARMGQRESVASAVPETAKQGAEGSGRDWSWVEASVWTERMLAALDNGVQGGCWFSLIDKVYRPATLQAAWRKVAANAGAAGVDASPLLHFGLTALVLGAAGAGALGGLLPSDATELVLDGNTGPPEPSLRAVRSARRS